VPHYKLALEYLSICELLRNEEKGRNETPLFMVKGHIHRMLLGRYEGCESFIVIVTSDHKCVCEWTCVCVFLTLFYFKTFAFIVCMFAFL
jgi:hypothetical protein